MLLEGYQRRYPLCHQAGLDVSLGKSRLKLDVEVALMDAVKQVMPRPEVKENQQIMLYVPPCGDEDDRLFGKWFRKLSDGSGYVRITPLAIHEAYPELLKPGSRIRQLLDARYELHPDVAMNTILIREGIYDDGPNDGSDLERSEIGVEEMNEEARGERQGAFATLSVFVDDDLGAREEIVERNEDGYVVLSDHKLALGRIGVEMGEEIEVYVPGYHSWLHVLWDTQLRVYHDRIFLRKRGVTTVMVDSRTFGLGLGA
ncbi:hypothetical protein AAF712_011983 [Marasmius tenuissimus]|uniref:Uncharacterized protein n=1 Tax=Marasmius tenuissimus TaxID=585030 RepID=A0ABR2ZJS6_9AGAR